MGWDRDPGGVLRPSSIAGAIEIQRDTKEVHESLRDEAEVERADGTRMSHANA